VHRFAFLALVATLCGCGDVDELAVVPVTGTVTKGGAPVKDVRVTLATADPKDKAPLQMGLSGADGKFEIQTSAGQKGAVPGRYKVVLTDGGAPNMDYSAMGKKGPQANTEVIPKTYQSSTSTPLTVTVEPGTGATISAEIK
jgi:hypothetical protein